MDIIKRNKLFIAGAIFAAIMCISGIYAFVKTSTTTVTTKLNTGGVNIQLKEYSVENGQESEYTNAEQIVMPGEEVSLIPRITNLGDSCYVRAKFSYSNNGTNENFTDDSLKGMDSNWVKINNYWYYRNPIDTNANLDMFNTIVVPKNLSNDSQGKELNLNIVAEAVQAVNFTPDFTSQDPWGEIEIKANSDNSYRMARTQMSNNVTVEYDNQANVQIDVPEDFFGDLGTLMPGDELTHEIEITPAIGKNELLFTVRPQESADEKVIDLLQKLELQISSNGKTIFDGNMYQLDEQTLGIIPVNESTKYTFKVKMPIELDNEYAMLSTSIIWKFIVNQDVKDKVPGRFNLKIVKVKEDGKTIIKSNDTKFNVNGEVVDVTNGEYYSQTEFITSTNQVQTYNITETQAPEGYEKYSGTIKLNVGFSYNDDNDAYYIDENKTSINCEGLSGKIYEISGTTLIVYIPNSEIVEPPPVVEPEGKYTVEIVKVKEDGKTVITSDETVFKVNDVNYETKNGKYNIALNKDIKDVNQLDTYTIIENKEPKGYEKYTGTITLKVGFKLDEDANKYIINKDSIKCNADGLSGEIYKISEDGTKITIYMTNKLRKESEPSKPTPVSPQTGDVKIKISIIVFVIAAICLIAILILEKKNKKEKND